MHTTQLPLVTGHNPPKGLSADIAAVQSVIEKAIRSGNDVIVCPRSWAGMVAGCALVGYGSKERKARGGNGGVVRCGYLCAYMVPQGESLTEVNHGQPLTSWSPKFALLHDNAEDVFYNDLPPDRRTHWFKEVSRTHSLHPFTAKATGEAWNQIPTYYLICEEDLVILNTLQEAMTSMIRDKSGELRNYRFKSSHSPLLSHVDETVAWIRKVAGEHV